MELLTVDDYIKAKLTESVHTTGRRSFRGCRRRWSWIFQEFHYPTITAKPLEFGMAFHKAMEHLYSPTTWHEKDVALAIAIVVFKKTVEEQRAKYRETVGEMSDEEEKDYNARVELGLGMLRYYAKRFLPMETLTPVEVEIAFEVPIKHRDGRTLWCTCKTCQKRYIAWIKLNRPDYNIEETLDDIETGRWKGLPVTLGGRIDVLFKDEYGQIWIGDWKTTARIVEEGKDFFLENDDQITAYVWALWTLGIDVAGFLYMEIKKGFPKEPEPLQRLYKGRAYPTNKMLEHDYSSYVTIVEENDPIAFQNGLYDDYLDWLEREGPVYHYRHQQHRSEEELAVAGDNLFEEASDMVDPNLRIYPSPGRFTCQYCAFQSPCLAANRGDDPRVELETSFEKRSYHYWETAEPSTDGKGGQ